MGKLRGPKGGRKVGCATKICLVPWDGGKEGREAANAGLLQSWGMRMGVGFGGEEREYRSEDCLYASLACLVDGFPGNACGSWRPRQRGGVVMEAEDPV